MELLQFRRYATPLRFCSFAAIPASVFEPFFNIHYVPPYVASPLPGGCWIYGIIGYVLGISHRTLFYFSPFPTCLSHRQCSRWTCLPPRTVSPSGTQPLFFGFDFVRSSHTYVRPAPGKPKNGPRVLPQPLKQGCSSASVSTTKSIHPQLRPSRLVKRWS